MNRIYLLIIAVLLTWSACRRYEANGGEVVSPAVSRTQTITWDSTAVDVIIEKPAGNELDVLLVFHGTVAFDSLIHKAAQNTLDSVKNILQHKDMMLVSVAYPEENLLIGDNLKHAEAALLWVKNRANAELGMRVGKIFLLGHSQGGYLVTRLNVLHKTDGVIANAPGPLNLVFRCGLEEDGKIRQGIACTMLRNKYGSTVDNPTAYQQRSLLMYTSGYQSDILFVQGLDDSPVHMNSWPAFKSKVTACADCKQSIFHEVAGAGHGALFRDSGAASVFNEFIRTRR